MISENLSINFYLLPVVVILLMFLTVTFNFLFFKPLLKIIDERKKMVSQMKNEAHSMREEAKELMARYEGEVSHFKKEANKSFEGKKKEIVKNAQKKIQEAKAEAEKVIEWHHKAAMSHYEKAKSVLIRDIDSLTSDVVKTVLETTTFNG